MLRHIIIIHLFISSGVMISVQLERSHFLRNHMRKNLTKLDLASMLIDLLIDPRPISA